MKNIDDYASIYFVGAGGIGMAALERYFLAKGMQVAGYDRTSTELTDALRSEGVAMVFDDDPALIPASMLDPENTLVVYTPAVGRDNHIMARFAELGFEPVKRARLLGMITQSTKALCFAGTHGKTTTSSMAAHMLHRGATGCNAFLGGVLRNYGSNLLLSATSPFSVVEADEYDRSFHWLHPYVAVVTATDPDHLDIYGTEEAYLESFTKFTSLIQPGGALVMHTGLKLRPALQEGVRLYTYGADEGDYHAADIVYGNGTVSFTLVTPDRGIEGVTPGVPVAVNVDNAVAAMAALDVAGLLDTGTALPAMADFMGPKRRFEFWRKESPVVIDDYAHHPDELRASIDSVRRLYPGARLTVAFQPHLYSRTRDFAPAFAEALSKADEVVLLDIYPAREEPIPGVTSQIIFDAVTSPEKVLIEKKDLAETLKKRNFEVLLTVGAGDICNYLPQIVDDIKHKNA